MLRKYLPRKLTISEDKYELGAFSKGIWDLSCINERLRFCKYLDEGLFSPHYVALLDLKMRDLS